MPFQVKLEDVKAAAEALVRAEWEFRCGLIAYHLNTQEWYEDAAEGLRRALTGEKDLGVAGERLGKSRKDRPPLPRKKLAVSLFPEDDIPKSPAKRKRLQGGGFFSKE